MCWSAQSCNFEKFKVYEIFKTLKSGQKYAIFKIDKVIQHLLKVTPPKEYKKYMVSTNL